MLRTLVTLLSFAILAGTAHAEVRSGTARIGDPARAQVTKSDRAMKRIAVTGARVEEEDPVLSVQDVLTKIHTVYISGLQRCYRKTLASNPSVSGMVALMFTVDAKGRVFARLKGVDAQLDNCLSAQIATWYFPHAAEPAEVTFKLDLLLRQ